MFPYKRITIVGPCASGKSFLAKQLSEILNIKCYHMDNIYWQPNWTNLSDDEMRDKIFEIVKEDKWIIDGTYSKILKERLDRCDLLIFLDFDTAFCLEEEAKRRGKKRTDFPDYLDENESIVDLRKHILGFPTGCRIKIVNFIKEYKDLKVLTFYTREEVNNFIESLK